MILSRKINFERFKDLSQKEFFINELSSFVEKNPKSKIKKEDLKNFSFYLVIEYFNGFDSINYEKIFPQKGFFIDYQALQIEHDDIMNKIKKRFFKKEYPDFFNRLGLSNFVKGCYLIGGNNKDVPKTINKKSKSYISVKINFQELPKEIEEMCNEYYNKNSFYVDKEKEDFESFFKLTKREQEKMIGSFFEKFTNFANKTALFSYSNSVDNQEINNVSKYSIEEILDSSLDFFTDLNFLEDVFERAKQEEKYELCAKILNRINKIKGII
jgi:hypothetical protein